LLHFIVDVPGAAENIATGNGKREFKIKRFL
jgi:hypothetical protein